MERKKHIEYVSKPVCEEYIYTQFISCDLLWQHEKKALTNARTRHTIEEKENI